MTVRSNAVEQAAEQADDGGSHPTSPPTIPIAPDPTSSLSPVSHATSATMASPASPFSSSSSPLPFVTLADQASTPLSLDTSDMPSPGLVEGGKSPVASETGRLLSTSKSMEALRRTGNLSRSSSSNSTVPAASTAAGSNIVSAMVESFEALHKKNSNSNLGYELLRTKSAGQRPQGPVPHPTISPSPSVSRSPSPSPAKYESALEAHSTGENLGAADQKKHITDQDAKGAAPQTAAAPPVPVSLAPTSNAAQAHDASSLPASSTSVSSPSTIIADAALIRPIPSTGQPSRRNRANSNPIGQPIVRTSSNASVSLSHPAPDPNKLSQAGNYLGNIAALEATAERLSMTSSIEDAIREEHNELKRSESRRSSILRARAASTSDNGSVHGQSQLSVASRQNSILGINNAARSGGYSPGGFIMSPHHSMSATSGRLRSGSKASSTGVPSHIPENADIAGGLADVDHPQEFRFLPRHGPGKASTRSVASKLSLAQIAELEQPTALTKEAFDEADRAAANGDNPDVEDAIRSSAYQIIEAEFARSGDESMLGHDAHGEPNPRLQLHQPDQYQPYGGAPRPDNDRPTTSGSGTTYEQAQAAFGDFDGVHCDPDVNDFATQSELGHREPLRPQGVTARPPTTYIDPATGQQMLYYPAPVPAMLNLPPKLSKKPKGPARDIRRSQIVSAMPKAARESRFYLPDPTAGLRRSNDGASFMGSLLGEGVENPDLNPQASGLEEQRPDYLAHARHPSEASTIHPPLEQREIRRPQRLADADNRKSRPVTVDGMPPHLRASAFFDLPSEVPKIEVKDGSAMSTLDNLLDASAAAPVSAFTDHVFAGKLGAEVYGPAKKRKVKKTAPAPDSVPVSDEKAKRKTLVKRNSSGNLLEHGADDKPKRKTLVKRNSSANLLDPNSEKKRASRFSLFGTKAADDDTDDDDRSKSGARSDHEDTRYGSASPNQLAPDEDEETETESEEEAPVYQGPPTTLLAELQLRKQQDKQRTRPLTNVDGMRSTLLELNAVAEVERKARHGKRVTLAWEDPAAVPRQEEEDDEDVPLGMLFAAKAAAPGGANRSTMDVSALMSEVHRPLGLMERREMEENEPLSRRRDRLQGKVTEQLPTSLTALQKRISHMPGTPGSGLRSQSRLNLPLPQSGGSRSGSMLGSRPGSAAGNLGNESEPEIEGETLAARKARLAAENPLPRARPVSGAFSAELLREFGPDEEAEEEAKKKADRPAHSRTTSRDTDASGTSVPEEEETLGQRRRRLQREREAREREMAFSTLNRAATPLGLHHNTTSTIRPVTGSGVTSVATPSARPSTGLSHVLNTVGGGRPAMMTMDPREQERLRREAEAAHHQRETEAKMAALRAQMPMNLAAPAVGAHAGGFMGGRFNDGVGGGVPQSAMGYGGAGLQQQRTSTLLGAQGIGMGMGMPMGMGIGQGMMYGGSTPNLGVYPNGVAASMSVNALPLPGVTPAYGMPMGAGGQGHMDMVERWRQSVMP
ncbi:hypothetical protein VTI28DRAFT_2312 [Corynascus sepedonium]